MTMHDLTGARVAISARTLTAKDENGKTRGMVRGITQFVNAAPRDQFQFSKIVRASGLWDAANTFDYLGVGKSIIIDGKNVYWLFNRRWTCKELHEIRDKVTCAGIKIIDCEIV